MGWWSRADAAPLGAVRVCSCRVGRRRGREAGRRHDASCPAELAWVLDGGSGGRHLTGMAQDQAGVPRPVRGASEADETLLVKALRCREEAAFVALVRRYHSLMLRVAYAQLNNTA